MSSPAISQRISQIKYEQRRPEYNRAVGSGIYDKHDSSYIASLLETAQDDVGQMLDRQNRVYFVTTIGCISAIIFAIMLNSKR